MHVGRTGLPTILLSMIRITVTLIDRDESVITCRNNFLCQTIVVEQPPINLLC